MAGAAKPDQAGHRRRLKERFLKAGPDGFADYELLELLLFLGIPRQDVRGLAKQLIQRFGGFGAVISASPASLSEVKGVGEGAIAALKTAQAAAVRLLRERIEGKSLLGSWQQVIDYLRADMAYRDEEHLRVLYLNTKNVLIADEVQQRGTVNHAPVYPREVAKRALALNASAVILVHNHPSGDPSPSRADVEMTREVREALKAVGIALHDHVVVGGQGFASLRTLGML
jgi:DNA repair protein RadC